MFVLGYGVAFPKNSMWIQKFNEKLMNYRQNGDLERMQRFWFTGACDPREKRRTSSKPLALAQVITYISLKLKNVPPFRLSALFVDTKAKIRVYFLNFVSKL